MVNPYLTFLKENKLSSDPIYYYDTARIKQFTGLIEALNYFFVKYRGIAEKQQLKMAIHEVLRKLMNIHNDYVRRDLKSLAACNKKPHYHPDEINKELRKIIDGLSAELLSHPAKIMVTDPTNTKLGGFLAQHITRHFNAEDVPQDNPYQYFFVRYGFAANLYDKIHECDPEVETVLFKKQMREAERLLQSDSEIGDRFQQYLFEQVPKVLDGTFFRYSERASYDPKQRGEFLWMFATHTSDFDDMINEKRIYVNIDITKACAAVKYIAETITDFFKRNSQVSPGIYFKFKIRTSITEAQRADTCICYARVHPQLANHAEVIMQNIINRVAKIPDEYLCGISSPLLNEVKPGVTIVDDNVITNQGESYTSQIYKSYWGEVQKYMNLKVATLAQLQKIVDKIIIGTLADLRKRKYAF